MADFEPKEEYQKKLKAFLSPLPDVGGPEVKSGTPAFPRPYDADKLATIKDKCVTNAHFKDFTGWEHYDLLKKWLSDRTTTCNEFCQKCALKMGTPSDISLNRFDIAEWLSGRGLGHCWIPGDSGATPEYGDIFRLYEAKPDHNGVSLNHMGVSLFVSGSEWFTAESGQGGPSKGFDAVARKKRVWKPASLTGWVSIKAILNAGKPLPNWAGGWWEVTEGSQVYYYYLEAGGKISFTPVKPLALAQRPPFASMTGTFRVKGMFGLEISWAGPDVDESFMLTEQDAKKKRYSMEGKTSGGVKMKAKRMMASF
ncbi:MULTISPECIES: hypothetical protein [Inhella]|uniref:Uncharacterized protein n=1 Tax=Inhella proteolytica TaxID=2795029 RepID=A0A931J0N0_9BURK|nr:hypothetical protein [Inhella proteolytica]MBH9575950.1 hypothetical protein [Inhella proteolytica]